MESSEELAGSYWGDNMLQPVLFAQALASAISSNLKPAIAVELGPHPALQGPALQTIEDVLSSTIPYSGTLKRGYNDVDAVSDTLGFIWSHFGGKSVDFMSHNRLFSPEESYTLIKGLPGYCWDHARTFWYESRWTRVLRSRVEEPHDLLGIRSGEAAEGEFRWRNVLRPDELPWLRGHQIQGETLFPAAGFACMAIEASKSFTRGKDVRLIEIHNLNIHRALNFNDEVAGVETIFNLSIISSSEPEAEHNILAKFECFACPNQDTGNLVLTASGSLKVQLGSPSRQALPPRPQAVPCMTEVDIDKFYSALWNAGYNYTDGFRGIYSMKRTAGHASGLLHIPIGQDNLDDIKSTQMMVHPVSLDVAYQSIHNAFATPADGRLFTLHIPTSVKCIQINPFIRIPNGGLGVNLAVVSSVKVENHHELYGDVTICLENSQDVIIQVEGLKASPISTPSPRDDRLMFAEVVWGVAEPDAGKIVIEKPFMKQPIQRDAELCERTCLFFLKKISESATTTEQLKNCKLISPRFNEWACRMINLISIGEHPTCKTEWLNDKWADIKITMKELVYTLLVFLY